MVILVTIFQDGLVSFEDFKLYLQMSQNQKESISRNQLTIEAISMVTKLYTENSNKTIADLRKIAVSQGLSGEFDKFFQFSTAEDAEPVDEEEFQKIVEILENQLYSMNDVGIDNQKQQASESESHLTFTQ